MNNKLILFALAVMALVFMSPTTMAAPSIVNITPINNAFINADSFVINFTSNETLNNSFQNTTFITVTNQSAIIQNVTAANTNFTNYQGNFSTFLTDAGNWSFIINVTSNSGASDRFGLSARINITRDTTTPALTYVDPANSSFSNSEGTLPVNYAASDINRDACYYQLNGASNVTVSACGNTSIQPLNGQNTIIVYVNDSVNRVNSSTISFVYTRTSSGGGGGGGGFVVTPTPVTEKPELPQVQRQPQVQIPAPSQAPSGPVEAIFGGIASFISAIFDGITGFFQNIFSGGIQVPNVQINNPLG